MRRIALSLSLALLAACSGSPESSYEKARAALDAGKPADALAAAQAGLGRVDAGQDPALAWRLESLRLEALAKGAKGAQVKDDLERLSARHPGQITAALYRSLADHAKNAGDVPGAIEILTAGDERFPDEHASFVEAIESLEEEGNLDPAQVQKLRSLGYL